MLKNNINRLVFFYSSALVLLSFSCVSSGEEDTLLENSSESISTTAFIDNGFDTTVHVVLTALEGEEYYEYDVNEYSVEQTMLPYGGYHIKVISATDSVLLNEDFQLERTKGIKSYNINLSQQDYIIENIVYAINPNEYNSNQKSFTYKGKTYEGVDAELVEGKLVHPKVWDYNIQTEIPDTVEIHGKYTIKKKLHRAREFKIYLDYNQMLNEYGDQYRWSE
ncbi:MAG: hypothetical protein HUJ25_04295 [Crocinitomicaceae bacterium]|nr:hypothetical protein [Crocinitomicaceae bacterium]